MIMSTPKQQRKRNTRSVIAHDLHTPKYAKRIVGDKKNIYNRAKEKQYIRNEQQKQQ